MSSLKFHTKARRANPEAQLQKAILQHLKLCGAANILYFHPANEGKRSLVSGANLKALGMLPGVADLVIIKDGLAHFLEVKTKDGRLSDNQKRFATCAQLAGCPWAVAYSIEQAICILRDWGLIKRMARVAA